MLFPNALFAGYVNGSRSYCRQLVGAYEGAIQQNKLCTNRFEKAMALGNRALSPDASLDKRVETYGHDHRQHPHFMSSGQQDYFVWLNHGRFMDKPGVFVDLAANDPVARSNTFVLEHCMGWRGLCIEP